VELLVLLLLLLLQTLCCMLLQGLDPPAAFEPGSFFIL
jgi:hypothetical protein